MSELINVYRRQNKHRPDAPAFTFISSRAEPYTYRELFERTDETPNAWSRLNLPRVPIGILLQRQEDQVLHYLGALAAGIVSAILTPPNPKLKPPITPRQWRE